MALSQFRGKAVVLAFVDSQCTTVCPLTTVSMVAAKELLGAAGSHVQLLGVDANPQATTVADAMAYSRAHAMVNQWDFLTGTLPQLQATWRAYHIAVQIQRGMIDHTPALFVIDPQGRERTVYLTQMNYASITQAAQIIAERVPACCPATRRWRAPTRWLTSPARPRRPASRCPACRPARSPWGRDSPGW